jgi:transcriptional regulator with XRE-family HTH domain
MAATTQLRAIILAALKAQRVRQVELARRTGLTEKHISQVLSGKCGLSLDVAEAMLAALGLDLVVSVVPSGIGEGP